MFASLVKLDVSIPTDTFETPAILVAGKAHPPAVRAKSLGAAVIVEARRPACREFTGAPILDDQQLPSYPRLVSLEIFAGEGNARLLVDVLGFHGEILLAGARGFAYAPT
jgi:hypothetical protein